MFSAAWKMLKDTHGYHDLNHMYDAVQPVVDAGLVDLIATQTLGFGWMVGEDALDRYAIEPIERHVPNVYVRALARSILKRWEWTDTKPRDLREAFLIHTIRSRESARESKRVLEAYKDSVREVLERYPLGGVTTVGLGPLRDLA